MTSHRGLALALIATAQFVLVLDITIVTVALPTIQEELGFDAADLQWVVTGYAVTFGGFLLLAGRAADLFGRRRMFVLGIGLFGAASLLAGLAVNDVMLIAARAIQGLAGAIVSPAALALLTTSFREGRDRNRALGIFGAVASAGGASGLLLGGVITDFAGWRWVFLVNVPVTAVAAIAALLVLRETRDQAPRSLDALGASAITIALVALIYGLTHGEQAGFDDHLTVASLAGAVAIAATFVVVERHAAEPLIPFRLFRLPTLLGSQLTSFSVSALVASTPFFLSLYIQRVLELSPAETGLAFLPMALTIMASSALAARLAEPLGVKPLLLAGLAALIVAALLLSRISLDGSYAHDVLPGMTLFAIGLGFSYTSTTIGGTAGVADAEQGIAGGLLNTFNQVGGAVGLAVLTVVAGGSHPGAAEGSDAALVAGLSTAFLAAVGFAALGLLAAMGLIAGRDCERELRRRRTDHGPGADTTLSGQTARLGLPRRRAAVARSRRATSDANATSASPTSSHLP